MSSLTTVAVALAVFFAWALATHLLERRPGTLLRPEDTGLRVRYALLANVLVGTAGTLAVLLWLAHDARLEPAHAGFLVRWRPLIAIPAAALLGSLATLGLPAATRRPRVMLNAFAQVWPVTVAEVLVCWSLVGATFEHELVGAGFRPAPAAAAAGVVAAVLFGLYHRAHSPPFDAPRMIALLTAVGFVTGGWFFVTRDVWSTAVLHNFLALRGVLQALAEADRLGPYRHPRPALLLPAAAAAAVLAAGHLLLRTLPA